MKAIAAVALLFFGLVLACVAPGDDGIDRACLNYQAFGVECYIDAGFDPPDVLSDESLCGPDEPETGWSEERAYYLCWTDAYQSTICTAGYSLDQMEEQLQEHVNVCLGLQ